MHRMNVKDIIIAEVILMNAIIRSDLNNRKIFFNQK